MQMPDYLEKGFILLTCYAQPITSFAFGTGLPVREDGDCATAYCSETHLGFNPEFMRSLSDDESAGVQLHEWLHYMFNHAAWIRRSIEAGHVRGIPFDPKEGNCSLDCVVNDISLRFAGVRLPGGHVTHPGIDWRCSEDDAYEIWMRDRPSPPPGGGGDDKPGCGGGDVQPDKSDAPGKDGASSEAQRETYRTLAAVQALKEAVQKLRGLHPGVFEGLLDRIQPVSVDWRGWLQRSWRHAVGADQRTWRRPGRVSYATGIYLPGRIGRATGDIVWQVDTSGSVSDAELRVMFGAMVDLAAAGMPERLTILQTDAVVQDVTEITAPHELADLGRVLTSRSRFIIKGRGGTDMRDGWRWLVENKRKPSLMITSTDGYTPFPDGFAPAEKSLWLVTQDTNVPAEAGQSLRVKV